MSMTKLPPFTIARIVKHYDDIKNNMDMLTQLFHDLILIEYEIKTGQTPVEIFWPYIKTKITHP